MCVCACVCVCAQNYPRKCDPSLLAIADGCAVFVAVAQETNGDVAVAEEDSVAVAEPEDDDAGVAFVATREKPGGCKPSVVKNSRGKNRDNEIQSNVVKASESMTAELAASSSEGGEDGQRLCKRFV